MKLTEKELAATGKLSDDFDQHARFRDINGRTLTEIQAKKVGYKLNPAREKLMHYDNRFAEMKAKLEDERYTEWIEGKKLPPW